MNTARIIYVEFRERRNNTPCENVCAGLCFMTTFAWMYFLAWAVM